MNIDDLPLQEQRQVGAAVLMGARNWKEATLSTRWLARLFGTRLEFEHMGKSIYLKMWRGKIFLTNLRAIEP